MSSVRPIKKPVAVVLFIALVAAGIYFYVRDISRYIPPPRDSVVFKGLTVHVYKSGAADGAPAARTAAFDGRTVPLVETRSSLKWKLRAREVRLDSRGEVYTFSGIADGTLYREKKPPFRFTAKSALYNSKLEEVIVNAPVRFRSENGDYFNAARVHWFGRGKRLVIPKTVRTRLDGNTYSADSLESEGEDMELVTLRGNARAFLPDIEESGSQKVKKELDEAGVKRKYLKNFTARADEMRYYGREKRLNCLSTAPPAIIPPDENPRQPPADLVLIDTDRFEMRSRELLINFENKSAVARTDVWIRRKPEEPDPGKSRLAQSLQKKDVFFTTDEARYTWKQGFVEAPGEVVMTQENLDGRAGRALFNTKSDLATLLDGVVLHQTRGDWLIAEKIVAEDAPERAKKIARDETTISSAGAEINFDTGDISASGTVNVLQKERSLLGSSAEYAADVKTWRVFGTPLAADGEESIAADIFIYDEEDERFTALGNARSEFLPEEKHRDDIEKFFRERDGDEEERGRIEKDRVSVAADLLDHNRRTDVLTARGDVILRYRDVVFTAPLLKINYKEKTIEAENGVTIVDRYARSTAEKLLANWETRDAALSGAVVISHGGRKATKDKKEIEPFTLKCGEVAYNWEHMRGEAGGSPVITSKGRWIAAQKFRFDADAGRYDFSGGVRMHQDNGDWLREKGYVDEEKDERFWKVARDAADAECDEAHLDEERDHFLLAGNVVVTQQDRRLEADRVEFFGELKRITAAGKVRLHQTRGDWLFEKGLIGEEEEEDVKERARGRVDLLAGEMESNYGEKRTLLSGGVSVTQGESTVKAGRVWHDDKNKKTLLEEHVEINDEKERALRARRVLYDGKTKTLEAFDDVAGKAKVKTGGDGEK
ncbi:MAG: LptA/OstA family protein [bacterium]